MAELTEGQKRTGSVTSLRDFGAFVDLGGADGLIHLSELAWRRVRHPRDVVKPGDQVEVLVIKVDRQEGRIGLSLKQLQPTPWEKVNERLSIGQTMAGRVTRLTAFGAFVELLNGDGLEGLLHTNQITGGPSTLHEGQELSVRILNIDVTRQRLALGMARPRTAAQGDAPADLPPNSAN